MTAVGAEPGYRNMTAEWCRDALVAKDAELRDQYAQLARALEDNRNLLAALKPFGGLKIHAAAPDEGMVVLTNLAGGIVDTGPDCRIAVRDIRNAVKIVNG